MPHSVELEYLPGRAGIDQPRRVIVDGKPIRVSKWALDTDHADKPVMTTATITFVVGRLSVREVDH